jgi:transmembrane sensor
MRPWDAAPAADLAEEAAVWIVQLDSDDPAERSRAEQGFAAWRAQSPQHAETAERLESFIGSVKQVGAGDARAAHAARAALDAAHQGVRRTRQRLAVGRAAGALVLAAVLALPTWLALHQHPPAHLWADLRSSSGQWQRQTLSDGSQITLSGVTAIRWRADERERVVELLGGSLLVDVAKDATRPFYVQTPLGRIRALGTRFAVTYGEGGMTLEMLESRVMVQGAASEPPVEVVAGQRVHAGASGMGAVEAVDAASVEQGWQSHQLVANDQPLPEVLDRLAVHHAGPLYFDRAALAGIRVSAVLPLDDTAQALRLLQQSFPQLRLRSVASRWVWVGLQPAP